MTMTLDLQTSFKVTASPLIKGIVWVMFEPDWSKQEKICFKQGFYI